VGPDEAFNRIRGAFSDKVRFTASPPAEDLPDRDGCFLREDGRDQIWIRAGLQGIERLATLLHELGHHLSCCEGWPDDYKDAAAGPMVSHWRDRPIEQRRAVLDEEVVAWRYGLRLAEQYKFDDQEALLKIALERLEDYRDRVDLPEVEFDMVVASL
jgi:hypothetical protein